MKKADAAVFRLSDGNYGIFSVDVLAPIVDDPETFGRIVFANCISDVCAMGGKPLVGLNVALFTSKADIVQLSKILAGASKAAIENGTMIAGGHTAKDQEIKYGIAVYGQATQETLMISNKAQAGDQLILTKPIGTGIFFAAFNAGQTEFKPAVDSMIQTNLKASEIFVKHGCKCCTDVTGFGLAATLLEVLEESQKSAVIRSKNIPLLPGVGKLALSYTCPVLGHNIDKISGKMTVSPELDFRWVNIVGDAQTSGGLLGFVKKDVAERCLEELILSGYLYSSIIGEVTENADLNLIVE